LAHPVCNNVNLYSYGKLKTEQSNSGRTP